MASTNKTPILKLNQFLGTDKVKRADFNYDNQQLEELLKQAYKTIEQNNNTISFTKFDGTQSQIQIATDIDSATDTVEGKISKNVIKELILSKIREFGIGTNTVDRNINPNDFKDVGIYVVSNSRGINNKTTVIINAQYDNDWGAQLGITEEDNPKIYVRSKRNGRWTAWSVISENFATNNEILSNIITNSNLDKSIKTDDVVKIIKNIIGVENVKQFRTGVSYASGDIVIDRNLNIYEVIKNVSRANIINTNEYSKMKFKSKNWKLLQVLRDYRPSGYPQYFETEISQLNASEFLIKVGNYEKVFLNIINDSPNSIPGDFYLTLSSDKLKITRTSYWINERLSCEIYYR